MKQLTRILTLSLIILTLAGLAACRPAATPTPLPRPSRQPPPRPPTR